ncbi:MAG: hypothetical protein U0324_39480 [Polyangiales bacterium]
MNRSSLLAPLLLACASTVGGASAHVPDGSPAPDTGSPDGSAAPDVPTAPDAGCAGEPAIDGDARAVTDDLDVRYVVRAGEMRPGRPSLDDDGCGARDGATHAFSLRFTAARRAWLRVTVESPGGGAPVERIVVARGCGSSRERLACVGAPAVGAAVVRTPEPVAAGERVTVSVGALPQDVVVRVVSVVVERAIGAACDVEEGRDVCAQGGRCVRGTCIPAGVLEGACRVGAAPCDEGLACVGGTTLGPRGVCSRVIRADAPCVYGDACDGGACVPAGAGAVCRVIGALRGPCRATEPRCDASLRCVRAPGDTGERCYRAVASGAPCGLNAVVEGVCPEGDRCTPTADGNRCLREGSAGGRCRASVPVCDAGLACGFARDTPTCVADATIGTRGGRCAASAVARCGANLACDLTTFRCVDPLPAGAPCAVAEQRCAAGLTCGRIAGVSPTQGRCVAPGAEGAACRELPPSCDAGLVCSPVDAHCVRPLGPGAVCDPADPTRVCDGACVAERCQPRGTGGGPCRDVGEACDDGLACVATRGGERCIVPLPAGARCRFVVDDACAPGTACRLPAGTGEAVCQDDGTLSPPCDPNGGCAAGRRCVQGLCRPVVADGALCFGALACAVGSSCLYPDATVFAGECVRDGAPGAACRESGPPCDAGSVCRAVAITPWRAGQCAIEARAGEACGTVSPPRVCAAGLRCENGRCVG